jgi:hypothetical protein
MLISIKVVWSIHGELLRRLRVAPMPEPLGSVANDVAIESYDVRILPHELSGTLRIARSFTSKRRRGTCSEPPQF